jgi:PEP-CTERM motif
LYKFSLNNAQSGGSMKKVIALTAGLVFSMSASAASFLNGGFEDGNLGSWTFGGGSRSGVNNPNLAAADYLPGGSRNVPADSNQVSIVGPGNDPILAAVGVTLNRVFAGNSSARIGDSSDNYFVGAIRQQVVNYTAATLNFSWAAVLESQHGTNDSPLFTVRVTDVTAGTVAYANTFAAYPGSPSGSIFQSAGGGAYAYAPWQSISVNTTIGNTYAIELLAADCGQGGHFGYAYLDGFGSVAGGTGDNGNTGGTGTVPVPGTIALLALGLVGVALRRKQA